MREWRSDLEMKMQHYLLSVVTYFLLPKHILLPKQWFYWQKKQYINIDLMHHGTFSTWICCEGYREWRQTSPLVLLPKSFGSSSRLYVTRPFGISNFSLIVGEARNIYKIKKVCPILSKLKSFQNRLHSLQIYPSQLFSSKTTVRDNKSLHFISLGFPKCLSSSFLFLSIWNITLFSQAYI